METEALGCDHKDTLLTMHRIGDIHQQRGELEEALKYFNRILDILKTSSDEVDYNEIANALIDIGNVYLRRAQTEEMMKAFSEAMRYSRQSGKNDDDVPINGFDLYCLSKIHPECAGAA